MVQKIPPAFIALAVLVVIGAGIIVLTLMNSPEAAQPVPPGTGVQADPAATITTRIAQPGTPGLVNAIQETMVPQPGNGSSGSNATSAGVSPTHRYPATGAEVCIMVPAGDGFVYENNTGFNAGSVQNYSTPVPVTDPVISAEQAKGYAAKAFTDYSSDRVEAEYSDGSRNERGWSFSLYRGDRQLVLGTLSVDGNLTGYSIPPGSIPDEGTANPGVTMDRARHIAENEIQERNGNILLKLADSQVNRDGNYVFSYRRIIRGVACSNDGISLIVSNSGRVIRYYKQWSVPENAVAAQTVPAVSRDAATALVERESRACYPESSDGFRILSAEPEWKDLYDADKFTLLPGVIPLTWHVRFDDNTIRAQLFPVPGEGWVDAQNGTLMSLYYAHGH